MANIFKGNRRIDGSDYDVMADAETDMQNRMPFKAILDVGMQRTTTGARIFGALKGACDGGIQIPHSGRRFPGHAIVEDNKSGIYDAKVHMHRIYGCHIDDYMEKLKEQSDDDFFKQFSKWNKCLSEAKLESCEDLFKSIHKKIIADPTYTKKTSKKAAPKYDDARRTVVVGAKGEKYLRDRKLTHAERKARLQSKIAIAREAAE